MKRFGGSKAQATLSEFQYFYLAASEGTYNQGGVGHTAREVHELVCGRLFRESRGNEENSSVLKENTDR